jgi:hypothetical protein
MGIRLTTKRQRNQAEENWKTSNIERSTSVFEAITLILARQRLGLRQPSGAFNDQRRPERQRAGALQNLSTVQAIHVQE